MSFVNIVLKHHVYSFYFAVFVSRISYYYVGTLHVPSQSYFPTTSQQCNQEVESVPTTPVARRQRRRNVDHKQSTPRRTRRPTAGVPLGNHVSRQITRTSLPCRENKWMPTFETNEGNIYRATTRVQHFHFWRGAIKRNSMLIEEICNKFGYKHSCR